jgi:hypothetical protein
MPQSEQTFEPRTCAKTSESEEPPAPQMENMNMGLIFLVVDGIDIVSECNRQPGWNLRILTEFSASLGFMPIIRTAN